MKNWSITQIAEADGRVAQQTAGHGEYAMVRLRIEPNKEERIVFESNINTIPKEFIKAVETGVRAAAMKVLDTDYPMSNIKVTLIAARHHELDSSVVAFERAGTLAFEEAVNDAKSILLEK